MRWQRSLALVEVSSVIVLGLGTIRVAYSYRDASTRLNAISVARPPSEIGERQSLAGLGVNGRGAHARLRRTARHAIIFVVRASSYRADVQYWNTVSTLLRGDSRVWLFGYCDGSACNAMTKAGGAPDFDLVAYGELQGLETAHDADLGGWALVTDSEAIIVSRLNWRSKSPETAADYLEDLP